MTAAISPLGWLVCGLLFAVLVWRVVACWCGAGVLDRIAEDADRDGWVERPGVRDLHLAQQRLERLERRHVPITRDEPEGDDAA